MTLEHLYSGDQGGIKLLGGDDNILRSMIFSLPSVFRVKINQTVIGWLAVLQNNFLLVHVAVVLRLELS